MKICTGIVWHLLHVLMDSGGSWRHVPRLRPQGAGWESQACGANPTISRLILAFRPTHPGRPGLRPWG